LQPPSPGLRDKQEVGVTDAGESLIRA